MKKSPSPLSNGVARDGLLYFQVQPVIESEQSQVWVDRTSAHPDSHVLVSISSGGGEVTTLITDLGIEGARSKDFVQVPEERAEVGSNKWVKGGTKVVKAFGYVFFAIILSFSLLSATGVIKARVVLTGSMVPAINPGDIVITANPKRVVPHIGSVVAYQARRFDGQPVGVFSHRIIGGDAINGFIVKGDHNPSPDIQRPKMADILGTAIFVIPFIGKFLTKQALFFIIPIVIGVWVAFDGLKETPIDA